MKKLIIVFLALLLTASVSWAGPRIIVITGGGGGDGDGDVTGVGDCASGACFDGSSDGGTYLSLYDAQGATKLQVGDNSGAVTITLPTTTGTLMLTDAEITALAGVTSAANAIPYFTGSGTAGVISSSANMVSLLGSADYATARENLGVKIGTNVQAYDAQLDTLAGATANTASALVTPGTAGNILKSDGTDWTSSNSLSIATLDMTSGTSSIPMTVTTSDGAQTAAGQMHYESDDDTLSIGDGTGRVALDFTAEKTYTFPAVDATLASLAGSETLTNKTLTTPVITSLEVLIDCAGSADPYAYCTSANASTLTATQASRTIINSYGRGEAQTVTLPAAATGMTFIAMVGTQHNSAWKIQRAGSDTITWSASGTDTTGKTYFQETNQAVGSRVSCITYKSGAAAWSWLCGSVTGTWVTD